MFWRFKQCCFSEPNQNQKPSSHCGPNSLWTDSTIRMAFTVCVWCQVLFCPNWCLLLKSPSTQIVCPVTTKSTWKRTDRILRLLLGSFWYSPMFYWKWHSRCFYWNVSSVILGHFRTGNFWPQCASGTLSPIEAVFFWVGGGGTKGGKWGKHVQGQGNTGMLCFFVSMQWIGGFCWWGHRPQNTQQTCWQLIKQPVGSLQ